MTDSGLVLLWLALGGLWLVHGLAVMGWLWGQARDAGDTMPSAGTVFLFWWILWPVALVWHEVRQAWQRRRH